MRATRVVAMATLITAIAPLAFAASSSAAVQPPVLGRFVDVARLSGTVRVTQPGGRPSALTGARRLRVHALVSDAGPSIVNASHGSVRLTAAGPHGTTYSGQFSNGTFAVTQTPSDGAIEISFIGESCQSSGATDATGGARVRVSRRHRHPYVRSSRFSFGRVQVDAPHQFVVIGNDLSASATAPSAQYQFADTCDATHVFVQVGQVVTKRSGGPTAKLGPDQSRSSRCGEGAGSRLYCLDVISSPGQSMFSFGVSLTNFRAARYKVCYTTPSGKSECFSKGLEVRSAQHSSMTCLVNDGSGSYPLRFSVAGRRLDSHLQFTATRPSEPSMGPDSCTGASRVGT